MFTLKQKYIIVLLIAFALISLAAAGVFLFGNFGQDNSEPVELNNNDQIELNKYHDALHEIALQGKFPLNPGTLMDEMNKILGESAKVLYNTLNLVSEYQDSYGNFIHILLKNESCVDVVLLGEDGVLNTNDDISMSIIISQTDYGFNVSTKHDKMTSCAHNFISNTMQEGNCTVNSIIRKRCIICNYTESNIQIATGHVYSENIIMCQPRLCTICSTPDVQQITPHDFTKQVIGGDTLAVEGTCSKRSTYYFCCSYCNLLSDITFEGEYNENVHLGDYAVESVAIDDLRTKHTLNCSDCNKEFLSVLVENIIGDIPGLEYRFVIDCDYRVEYATSQYGPFTSVPPTFKDQGTHNVYYRIYVNDYIFEGVGYVKVNGAPEIYSNELAGTTASNPKLYDTPYITVNGTVYDADGILTMTVNDEPVILNDNGTWSYECKLEQYYTKQLFVCAVDIYGSKTTKEYFVAYDYKTYGPDIFIQEPDVYEYIHTNQTKYNLCGQVDLSKIVSVVIDGVKVTIDENGYWSKEINVQENNTVLVSVVAADVNGFYARKYITICHSSVESNIDILDFKGDIDLEENPKILISIKEPDSKKCHGIQSIIVRGLNSHYEWEPTNQEFEIIETSNGFIAFTNTTEEPVYEFNVWTTVFFNQESFEIQVLGSHGQHYIYTFTFVWEYEYIRVINITKTNAITGVCTTAAVPVEYE